MGHESGGLPISLPGIAHSLDAHSTDTMGKLLSLAFLRICDICLLMFSLSLPAA
jgi:hypothetical protein